MWAVEASIASKQPSVTRALPKIVVRSHRQGLRAVTAGSQCAGDDSDGSAGERSERLVNDPFRDRTFVERPRARGEIGGSEKPDADVVVITVASEPLQRRLHA